MASVRPLLSALATKRGPMKQSSTNRLPARSRLVDGFGEFLASRNQVNDTSYRKLAESKRRRGSFCKLNHGRAQVGRNSAEQDHSLAQQQLEHPLRFNSNNHQLGEGKTRVIPLLNALISRNQKNKVSLALKLLRAPAFLGALFSLVLTLSLMILYALSLHHLTRATDELPSLSNSQSGPRLLQTRNLNYFNDEDTRSAFESALTVQTECGSYIGAPEDRAIVFKGIPYASPPVGRRRWKRPRPIWSDPRLCRPNVTIEAREWRSHCAQLSPASRRFSGHEDCLHLDIYAPQLDQVKKLPVLVYIHGGFLAFGSSGEGQVNLMRAKPSGRLASELNVILVAFNYRLQALGFMTLVQLAQNNGPDGSEGNYGLWDQLVALNWIKRNIEPFGGDPDNIVLFGPDAASALPLALISQSTVQNSFSSSACSSPSAPEVASGLAGQQKQQPKLQQEQVVSNSRDLFRGLWLVDPSVYYDVPYELASQHYKRLFLSQSPCLSTSTSTLQRSKLPLVELRVNSTATKQLLECLLSMSAEQVVRHYLGRDDCAYRLDDQNSMPIHGIFADQFVTVDGELVQNSYPFIPSLDRRSFSSSNCTTATTTTGTFNGPSKDILLGSSAQAVEYWPCPRNLDQWTWTDFERYVATSLNSFSPLAYTEASRLYSIESSKQTSEMSPKSAYLTMVSDIRQVCPVNELSESLREANHRVNRYIVETKPSPLQKGEEEEAKKRRLTVAVARANSNVVAEEELANKLEGGKQLPQNAFHTWDLLAFFGFEFEPQFVARAQDLEFQRRLRKLVGDFAHKKGKSSDKIGDTFTVFQQNGTATQTLRSTYKATECEMWRQHLGRSYAWVS